MQLSTKSRLQLAILQWRYDNGNDNNSVDFLLTKFLIMQISSMQAAKKLRNAQQLAVIQNGVCLYISKLSLCRSNDSLLAPHMNNRVRYDKSVLTLTLLLHIRHGLN